MTVSGTKISLAAGESDVVIGSSTEPLAPYITAGFGGGADGKTGQIFVGGAEGGFRWGWRGIWLVVLGVGIVICL